MSSPEGPTQQDPTQPVAFTKPQAAQSPPAAGPPPQWGAQPPPGNQPPPYAPYGPPAVQGPQGFGVGRIIGLVLASLLLLFSIGVIAGGGLLAWAHGSRDADGFLSTGTESLSTPTAALSSAKVDINVGGVDWFADHLGTIRITATSTNGKPIFIGIAPQSDVVGWLGSTGIDQIDDLQFEPFSATFKRMPGSIAAVSAPGSQTFWTARSTGAATQTLNWKVTEGNWAVVVANADGSPGVAIAVRLGAKFSWLGPLSIGLIIAGVVLFIIATVIIILILRSRRRRPQRPNPPVPQYQ
ncbi:MAG TPA: hypothetical protein VHZ96_22870 [Frankiaceae bacterium]|nr:hypothetical protein [Frankiaceae bacterium]